MKTIIILNELSTFLICLILVGFCPSLLFYMFNLLEYTFLAVTMGILLSALTYFLSYMMIEDINYKITLIKQASN